MSKAPKTPHEVSTAYFGRYIMKRGRGENGALARLTTITAEKLEQEDVTREILAAWHESYQNEAESNPRNRAAAARVQLMGHFLRLLNCEPQES
jgi:hypothetical protein